MTNDGLRHSIGACADAESVGYVHFTRLAREGIRKAFQFILNDIDPKLFTNLLVISWT